MDKEISQINEEPEPGEAQLAELIRQAGEKARAGRVKAFTTHFKLLKAAVAEGASRRKHHSMP